jgi:DHA2 family methylenomycin A resistance protein-like MFS transporter
VRGRKTIALPKLGRELGGGVAGLHWVVDAYTIALAWPRRSAR